MNRDNVQSIYPLLPNQEAFWLANQHAPSDPGHLQANYRLEGALEPAVFEDAVQALLRQHELLRATIQPRDGQSPLAVVWKQVNASIQFVDLSSESADKQRELIGSKAKEYRQTPIDLSKAPPFRFEIFTLSPQAHELAWTFHHAFLDGWSTSLAIRDLLKHYDSLSLSQPIVAIGPKYSDFLTWRKTIDDEQQREFWRQQFEGFAGQPRLFPATTLYGTTASQQRVTEVCLSTNDAQNLAWVVKDHQLTDSSMASSIWALVLADLCQQDDVAFGTTICGRTAPVDRLQEMIGLFSNVVAMRVKINPNQTLVSLMQQTRDLQFEIQAFEHTPLVDVENSCKLNRGNTLLESLLIVENYPAFRTDTNLRLKHFTSGISTGFPLSICILPDHNWTIRCISDSATVSEEWVVSLLKRFIDSMLKFVETPGTSVRDFRARQERVSHTPRIHDNSSTRNQCGIRLGDSTDEELNAVPGSIGNPRNDIELRLTMIWERVLGVTEVRYDDNFFEIGGRSLTATRIMSEVEETFAKRFSPAVLIKHPTVESLAKLIGSIDQQPTPEVLVCFNSIKVGTPLICVNVGTETAMFYRHLASYFPDRPVIGTQSLGLDGNSKPLETVEEIAAVFLVALDTHFKLNGSKSAGLNGCEIIGYCAGCPVALELSHLLEARGDRPIRLISVDSGLKYSKPNHNLRTFRKKYGNILRWLPRYIRFHLIQFWQLIYHPIRDWIQKRSPDSIVRGHYIRRQVHAATLKAHFAYDACQVDIPIQLIRSSEFADSPIRDFHLKLKNHTTNKFIVQVVDSEHETILLEPSISHVAKLMRNQSD